MLGLANYMEASFNYGYGAAGREDAFLFTPESDPKLAPKHCNAAYRNILKAVFLSAPFLAVALLIAGVLGSHSIRKFAATLARGMGATADEVDIRGRWKARLSGRVVDAYISPEQPWIDARVAEKLCMGAPIAYKLHPDAKRVTPDWLIEHVVPRTHAFYDGVNDISLHLALPLLWAALDESWEERMEPPVRVRIQDAYERIKADIPVGVNPVVKVPLSIWTHNTKLHINEIEPMDTGGGGGTAGGTTGTTGQASTRQVANQSRQVTAMQTQQQVRTNEEILTRIIAQHNQLQQLIAQEGRTRDSSAAALRGWLETWLGAELTKLNGNICRIAVQPPRMATPDQVDGNLFRNGLTVERTRRNGQTSLRYRQAVATTPADSRPAKLAKYRTVGSAWQEWMHGIGGNKPAKNFTADDIRACKSTYSRRKPLWTLMATLVNAQKAPAWVISKIEEHYKGSVLNITAAIKQDTIMGSLHEDLCIVRAQ
ncbi:expressed unknown protein [Seminavis robusta]|uniref:Transcription activator GCR1-like domain-containing protein n=1 Tax=Seminavis robusta TaxID=568900 RepID=A0A9N8DZI6_9STRA|nr:expressed unknown protein [Seminavis robusta]|eukprot:Sro498_g154970.1 n/a (484) ;mRNA; r:61557-63089